MEKNRTRAENKRMSLSRLGETITKGRHLASTCPFGRHLPPHRPRGRLINLFRARSASDAPAAVGAI